MAPIDRSEQLHVRIAAEEIAMLRALADAEGLTGSDIVRSLIRRAYRETFGDQKPKTPKK